MENQPQIKSGNNKFLVILLIVAAFVIGSLWQKNQRLEITVKQPAPSPQVAKEQVQAINPLDVTNLKKYAKELGLNQSKFDTCLDNSTYKSRVEKDIATAQNQFNISGTPAFLINGRKLGGAFPLELFKEVIDKELVGKGSDNVSDYSQPLQEAAQQQAFDPKQKQVTIESDDPVKGPNNAPVTIVEFSDFQCPYCVRAFPTVEQLFKDYEGKIRFVYKQLPLTNIHPYAQKAAEASLCAKEQGKFFEYHDKLFISQGAI